MTTSADKGVRKWLEGFATIGPVTADAYVRSVGGTYEDVENDMRRGGPLLKKMCRGADHKTIMERFAERSPTLRFLEACGVSEADALRVPSNVDQEAICADPYTVLGEILSFGVIDRLYLTKMGGRALAPVRVTALTANVLETEFGNDMYVPLSKFIDQIQRIPAVGPTATPAFLEVLAKTPHQTGRIVLHNDELYTRANYEAEKYLPGLLRNAAARRSTATLAVAPADLPESLDDDQRRAVVRMLEGGVVCIAGQAGSGKTQVATVFTSMVPDARLLAFTGAAAANIASRTGLSASTIDAFLLATLPDPPPDHVLIDEASMVSAAKLHAVLRKVPDAHVYLLGDPAQLPPIGQGEPFRDLCDRADDGVVLLTHNHRQEARDAVDVLRGVAEGRWPSSVAPGGAIRLHTVREGDFAVAQVLRAIDNPADDDTQFLASTNATCAMMNNALQPLANPNVPNHLSVGARVYSTRFRGLGRVVSRDAQNVYMVAKGVSTTNPVRHHRHEIRPTGLVRGDRVVLTKNHNDLGVVNGSVGKVLETRGGAARVAFDDRALDIEAKYLQHAYCMTVHKMQGREKARIVYLAWDAFGDRRLVYSACTRFTQTLHVFHQDWPRFTRLVARPVPRSASRIVFPNS